MPAHAAGERPWIGCASSTHACPPSSAVGRRGWGPTRQYASSGQCCGDGTLVASQAEIVPHLQADRPQSRRLLAFHDAATAAVALLVVNGVLVEIVQRIVGIDVTNHRSLDGVAWAEFLGGQAIGPRRTADIEVGRTDAAATALGVVVHRADRGERQDTMRRANIAHLVGTRDAQANVDALVRRDDPGVAQAGTSAQHDGRSAQRERTQLLDRFVAGTAACQVRSWGTSLNRHSSTRSKTSIVHRSGSVAYK